MIVDIYYLPLPILDTAKTTVRTGGVQGCYEIGIILASFYRKQAKVQKFK